MKPRRVFVILELETDIPLKQLKFAPNWRPAWYGGVLQVQANVARQAKPKARSKRKSKR